MSTSALEASRWPPHSHERPQPPVVDPGPYLGSAPPPSDAVVLFDGRSLDQWRSVKDPGAHARWVLRDDAMEVVAGTGNIHTVQVFGDVQLHVEWRTPFPPTGSGQGRGNSGVFLMQRYEIQVLDSYDNPTYADGVAGAIYGQFPPRVTRAGRRASGRRTTSSSIGRASTPLVGSSAPHG